MVFFFQINPKQELLVIKTTQKSKNSWPGKTLSKHFKDASPFEGIYSLFFGFLSFFWGSQHWLGVRGVAAPQDRPPLAQHCTGTPCKHTCTFFKKFQSVEQMLKPFMPGAALPQPVYVSSPATASRLPAV